MQFFTIIEHVEKFLPLKMSERDRVDIGNVYFSPFLNCTTNNSMNKHTDALYICLVVEIPMSWDDLLVLGFLYFYAFWGEREEDVLTVDSSTMAMNCMNHHLHSAEWRGAARTDNGNFFCDGNCFAHERRMMERREKSQEPSTTLEAAAAIVCWLQNGWEREKKLREILDRHYWKRSFN